MEDLRRIAARWSLRPASATSRRNGVVASAAGLIVIGASAFSAGGGGVHLIGAALADPLAVFASRSPGERTSGALTQTKVAPTSRARPAGRGGPRERVLSEVRTRPPLPAGPTVVAPFGFAPAELPGPFGAVPLGGPGTPIGFPGLPGGGGGPPDVIGTPSGGGEVPPVPSGVPEPASWLTMILGLGLVARVLRSAPGVAARRPSARGTGSRTGER